MRILVIKFGALGDFVQATGPFAAIHKAHPSDQITLLTTPPFAPLAHELQLFDEIWDDGRPKALLAQAGLVMRLRKAGFARVYDLQTSERSSLLFQLLRPNPPEWSGIARGASFRHDTAHRTTLHTIDRQAEQLAIAGIAAAPAPPDLAAVAARNAARAARFGLAEPYALLVPGGSPHRPVKRWPAENFAALANDLAARKILPVLIGGAAEAEIARTILALAPATRSLTGETDFLDILALGAKARVAIGNDTGPMHLIAAAGAPALVLFGPESDPALCAPRGENVHVLRASDLAALPVADVVTATIGLPPSRRRLPS